MTCAACNDTELGPDFDMEWVKPCDCGLASIGPLNEPYPVMSRSERERIQALGDKLKELQ